MVEDNLFEFQTMCNVIRLCEFNLVLFLKYSSLEYNSPAFRFEDPSQLFFVNVMHFEEYSFFVAWFV